MKTYPKVVNEFSTIREVSEGKSIARFGDGEFNLVKGGNCISQIADRNLMLELQAILKSKNTKCLIGIPTMDRNGPKQHWFGRAQGYAQWLKDGKTYHSAFITRPDSAPWIMLNDYWNTVENLWAGKDVVLVGCGSRSLNQEIMGSARSVTEVLVPRRDAYEKIDEIEAAILRECKEPMTRVFLCAGPTATCLAHRLSEKDIHAMDMGHIGMFWRRLDV